MEIEALVKFFGYPTQNADFDVFLSEHGIPDRPIYDVDTENPVESIELPEQGMALRFCRPLSYQKWHGEVREEGEMIFEEIFIYTVAEDGYSARTGQILAGLAAHITQEVALAQYGKPALVRDEGDSFGRPNNIEYMWDGIGAYSIFVRFQKQPAMARHIVISPSRIR